MQTAADALFERYQRTRDPELLARVFDALAPRLLRLAIHLARDGASAEDLVQATFLAAIERAREFDRSRELEPWLLGILSNKAKLLRREAARRPDPSRMKDEASVDPARAAQETELSREVQKAIDELEEPYRAVLLLHFVHGLDPAEIAHVLDRAPGTVRVQLHRAKEQVRKRLPEGLALPAFLAGLPERGLDLVRKAVLAHARIAAGIGTGLLMKKALVLAVVVLMLLVAWRSTAKRSASSDEPHATQPIVELTPAASPAHSAAEPVTSSPDPVAEREALAPATEPVSVVRGRVLDGKSGEPIAGARVCWYPGVRTTIADLQREQGDLVEQNRFGSAHPLLWLPVFDRQESDPAQELSAAPLPRPDDRPGAETRSRSDGSFELSVSRALAQAPVADEQPDPERGTLTCAAPGRGTAAVPLDSPWLTQVFRLWPEGKLSGHLVDPSGKPLAQHLRLLFGNRGSIHSTDDERELRGTGAFQLIETEPDGSFELSIGAESVFVFCRTPGWALTNVPSNPHVHFFNTALTPGEEEEPILLAVHRAPTLLVLDASDDQPIETFSLRCICGIQKFWSGRFYAPGGLLTLTRAERDLNELGHSVITGTAWAEGHRFGSFEIDDLGATEHTVVRLERGVEEPLRGRVLRSGVAVEATIRFQLHVPGWSWRADDSGELCSVHSQGGAFSVVLPPGSYVMQVRLKGADDPALSQIIELPHDGPLVVELDRLATLRVSVRDSSGTPRVDHVVAVHDRSARSEVRYTDAMGVAELRGLPAGRYEIDVPFVSTHESFSAGAHQQLELAEGETRALEITIPAQTGPRFAHLVVAGVEDFSAWRAKADSSQAEPVAVESDGRVPIDLQQGLRTLEIAHPDGRRWHANVPADAPDGYAIHLDVEAPSYLGRLLSLDGKPRPGEWLELDCPDPSRASASRAFAITDERGEFRLTCCDAPGHKLRNHPHTYGFGIGFALYRPSSPPATPARTLELRIPAPTDAGIFEGLAEVRISGRVRSASARALATMSLSLASLYPDASGVLELHGRDSYGTTDAEGRFSLHAPLAHACRVMVVDTSERNVLLDEELALPPGVLELEHDLWTP